MTQAGTFNEVVALLMQVRDQHANEYADARLANLQLVGDMLGGLGVELTNRWGGVVEIGPGRDVWFLFRLEPAPCRCYSDHPTMEGSRVFYLDGGHYTELEADWLVSRDECLRVLRAWLDTGAFPDEMHAEPQ